MSRQSSLVLRSLRGLLLPELGFHIQPALTSDRQAPCQILLGGLHPRGVLELSGRVMFELSGVPEDLAREAMRLAGHKLPIKTKFVQREGAGQQ